MCNKRRVLLICGLLAAILCACLLFLFNPETTSCYPRCPFYALTGLQCPGCGTLRGLHALMHLQLADAWHFNPAMIVSIPVIVSFLLFPRACKNVIVGKMILVATLVWWIVRNF